MLPDIKRSRIWIGICFIACGVAGCDRAIVELADMLGTKQFELTRTIGGGPTTVTAAFTFDNLGEC